MRMANETDLVCEEIDRINAGTAQGEQSIMVQHDMKKWAEQEGHWPQMDYVHMIAAHGVARGWTQEGFTGMEIWG
jgi:hypothetical protein